MWWAVLAGLGAALIGLTSFAANASTPRFEITIEGGTLTRSDVEKALGIFMKHCSYLSQHQGDLVMFKALVKPEYISERLQRGWKTEIYVTLKISDQPNTIPARIRGIGRTAGQLLYFNIGGGETPGITGAKRISQFACGLPPNRRGTDSFKSVPELSFLQY
ncbi:hypothetical protein AA309_08725 [Microvirga vignae]|uniref:POTRA domain-containing protein n=1 Tax=Microvirga vignae TaxID=1225564 RepID=A0A0H1RDY2_9HYPH|nr:hypothetical protein [Microvirga vignae]KLK93405.1 hypothetical protein AA309_08725 [Microvirga vignae]